MSKALAAEFKRLATADWEPLHVARLRVPIDRSVLALPANSSGYGRVNEVRAEVGMPSKTGGIGGEAGLFLWRLTRLMRPSSVLEVGTRAGISALTFALALQANRRGTVTTVDRLDVNNGELRAVPGEPLSPVTPAELVERAGVSSRVAFVHGHSHDFLADTSNRFDLVLLDGSHHAVDVYREIQLALDRLNPHGIIVLDDVYPNFELMKGRTNLTRGPWMALQRHLFEGAGFQVCPVGPRLGAPPAMAYLARTHA